jgi:hypothetical protein
MKYVIPLVPQSSAGGRVIDVSQLTPFRQSGVRMYPDGLIPVDPKMSMTMAPLPPPTVAPAETITEQVITGYDVTLPITHCDGESPAIGVAVTLGALSTTTDSLGHAVFLGVAAGTYTVTVAAIPGVPGGGSADPSLFVEDECTGPAGNFRDPSPGRAPDIRGVNWQAYTGATPGLAAPFPADDRVNAVVNGDGSWYYAGSTRLQMKSTVPTSFDQYAEIKFKITGSAGDGAGGSLILRGVEGGRAMAVIWTAISPSSGVEVYYAESGGSNSYTGTDIGSKPSYIYNEVITVRARIKGRKLTAFINDVPMFELTQNTSTFDTGTTCAWVFVHGNFAARMLRMAAGAVVPNQLVANFTRPDGTLLTAYTCDSGHTFSGLSGINIGSGNLSQYKVASNRMTLDAVTGTGYNFAKSSWVPQVADYYVQGVVRFTNIGSSHFHGMLGVRMGSVSGNAIGYVVQYGFDTGLGWRAVIWNAATGATIAAAGVATPTYGTDYTLRLTVAGAALSASINGTTVVSGSDSTYALPGTAGFLLWNQSAVSIDSIIADDGEPVSSFRWSFPRRRRLRSPHGR